MFGQHLGGAGARSPASAAASRWLGPVDDARTTGAGGGVPPAPVTGAIRPERAPPERARPERARPERAQPERAQPERTDGLPEPPLSATIWRPRPDTLQVNIAGEIDMATSPRLRQQLFEVMAASDPGTALRIDLAGVHLIDASGIAVLVAAQRAARAARLHLSLHSPRGVILRLMEVLGVTEELRVVRTPPA